MIKNKCILCEEKLPENHPGRNSPYPLKTLDDGECCNKCNFTKVLPARIKLVRLYKDE